MINMIWIFVCSFVFECVFSNIDGMGNNNTDIIHEYENITVVENSNVEMWCNVSGNPPVKWYMKNTNGELLDIGVYGKFLQIRNITRECSAVLYTCVCDTYVKDFNITTQFPPFVDILIPEDHATINYADNDSESIQNKTFTIEKPMTGNVILVCEVESRPYNTSRWIVNGNWIVQYTHGQREVQRNIRHNLNFILSASEFKVISESTIQLRLDFNIIDGTEFGYWTCESENELGLDSWRIEIKRKYK